ncbi:hypothetical protein HMPREF0758_2497 [Serratia odorifera DSM 4582]|uniref:Uncharacterized protein n=1 Tax=Serratia odorifera DSM 4582 TaxID=667129 RepID=D4E2U7_SEROD|nr:hypothetical protein HMPREF0758_2497 [Serratia odorifera DSM 4582]
MESKLCTQPAKIQADGTMPTGFHAAANDAAARKTQGKSAPLTSRLIRGAALYKF